MPSPTCAGLIEFVLDCCACRTGVYSVQGVSVLTLGTGVIGSQHRTGSRWSGWADEGFCLQFRLVRNGYHIGTAMEGRPPTEVLIAAKSCGGGVTTILWIIAAILVIAGIVTLLRGGIVAGIVLIIVGLLVGPGGVSVFC
jgi:hypothetical protein